MSSFEYEGKNVEQALKQAGAELNLAPDQINYEILSHGSSGIFGLVGAKKARILVNLSEKTAEAENEITQSGVANSADSAAPGDHLSIAEDSGDRRFNDMPEAPCDLARTVLQRIVDAISSDAQIAAQADAERIYLQVSGGDAGLLIGKKGQTTAIGSGFKWMLRDTLKPEKPTWKNLPCAWRTNASGSVSRFPWGR